MTESQTGASTEAVSAQQAEDTTQAQKATRTPPEGRPGLLRRFARRDVDGMIACWEPGGIDRLAPLGPLRVPDEMRVAFEELFAAVPDMKFEVVDFVAARNTAAVRWRARGPSAAGRSRRRAHRQPRRPRGHRHAHDRRRLIRHNEAFYDGSPSPARSGYAAAGLRRRARDDSGVQRAHPHDAPALPSPTSGRSPRACGWCRAASQRRP